MTTKRKEPVLKACEVCGTFYQTTRPTRSKYCKGSRCRSRAWNEGHRVESIEDFKRDAVREYWRIKKREWRVRRKSKGETVMTYIVEKKGKREYVVKNRYTGHSKGLPCTTHGEAQSKADRLNNQQQRDGRRELRAMTERAS